MSKSTSTTDESHRFGTSSLQPKDEVIVSDKKAPERPANWYTKDLEKQRRFIHLITIHDHSPAQAADVMKINREMGYAWRRQYLAHPDRKKWGFADLQRSPESVLSEKHKAFLEDLSEENPDMKVEQIRHLFLKEFPEKNLAEDVEKYIATNFDYSLLLVFHPDDKQTEVGRERLVEWAREYNDLDFARNAVVFDEAVFNINRREKGNWCLTTIPDSGESVVYCVATSNMGMIAMNYRDITNDRKAHKSARVIRSHDEESWSLSNRLLCAHVKTVTEQLKDTELQQLKYLVFSSGLAGSWEVLEALLMDTQLQAVFLPPGTSLRPMGLFWAEISVKISRNRLSVKELTARVTEAVRELSWEYHADMCETTQKNFESIVRAPRLDS